MRNIAIKARNYWKIIKYEKRIFKPKIDRPLNNRIFI